MHIIIAGASGLIGGALTSALREQGHEVLRLVRRPARSNDEIFWNPSESSLDPESLRSATAIVSLSGASVGRLPWTKSYKKELIDSRIKTTRTICLALHALARDNVNVPMFVSASASGFYGSVPGETLTETDPRGDTFLAKLCGLWEGEAMKAADVTTVSLLRTSPILHPRGVLRPMITLTRFGLGGPLAGGNQFWPWISLEDEVRAIIHVIENRLSGPVNLAGPVAATNAEIGRALARKMRRPFLFPAPGFMLSAVLGRDATESLLTTDALVKPEVLLRSGFKFEHETAQDAIESLKL